MSKRIKTFILATLLCFMVNSAFAQMTVRGKVIDQQTQASIPGISIVVSGTFKGTVTNDKGEFRLQFHDPSKKLTFSGVGFETKTVDVKEGYLTVALTQSMVALDQVIISASRGHQSRTDAPLAVSKLSGRLLSETKATSLDQVLN